MNKSLLLIICDFLLISILALVEFVPEENEIVDESAVRESSSSEMVELLKMSLDHEAEQRERLSQNLEATREELSLTAEEREALAKAKESLEKQTSELDQNLEQTRQQLTEVITDRQELSSALEERERIRQQLQSELQQKLEELAQREKALADAQENLQSLQSRSTELETNLKVREAEKQILEQNLTAAQAEIERARIQAQRAQEQAESLSLGVTELAQSSSQIREQIARSETLSLNVIFRQYETNRIGLTFNWSERRLLGSTSEQSQIYALPVQTSRGVFAIFHTGSTPLNPSRKDRSSNVRATANIGNKNYDLVEVSYFTPEPSIAAVQIPMAMVNDIQLTPVAISSEPLRFENAVLINNSQGYYGEIPLRAPPGQPEYISVETKLFNRLFGEFSPSTGDFILSRQGELIGVMTQSTQGRIIRSNQFNQIEKL